MIRRILKSSVYILLEIISFLILMPVLFISCTVLLLTGKFSAFALRTRKENTNSGFSGLIERPRSLIHSGPIRKEYLLVAASPYPAITGEKVRK